MAFGTPGSLDYQLSGPSWTDESGGGFPKIYYTDISAAIPSLSADRVGVVMLSWQGAPTNLSSYASVVWDQGGTPVTMSDPAVSAVQGTGRSDAWYLIGCAHNATITIRIRATFSAAPSGGIGLCTVAWGDNDSDAVVINNSGAANGSGTNAAVADIPISAAGLAFSASGHDANAITSLTGCTLLESWDSGGNCFQSAYSLPGSPATVTHTHTYSQTGGWHIVGLSFVGDAANGPPTAALTSPSDAATVTTDQPSFVSVGTDPESDDVTKRIQITNAPSGWTAGAAETFTYEGGSGTPIHPAPVNFLISNGTALDGWRQTDDRPTYFAAAVGGVLDKVRVPWGNDEGAACNGHAYLLVSDTEGIENDSGDPLRPLGADIGDGGVNTPTPGWIAISDAYAYNPGSNETAASRELTFSGANRIQLVPGRVYAYTLLWRSISDEFVAANTIQVITGTADGVITQGWIDGRSANYGEINLLMHMEIDEEFVVLDKESDTDAGFSGTGSDPFPSGSSVTFVPESGDALVDGEWRWRVQYKDPSGSDTYGDWSSERDFTVDTDTPTFNPAWARGANVVLTAGRQA